VSVPVRPVASRLEVGRASPSGALTSGVPVEALHDESTRTPATDLRAGRGLAHGWLWQRYAGVYDALEGLTGYREMVDAVIDVVGPVQGKVVAEVGCGTGNLLVHLLRQEPAHLLGIDASEAMLRRVHAKIRPAIRAGRVAVRRADAVTGLAEIPAGTADVIIASNVLYALPDRRAFWRQAAHALRPDGRVVVSNPDRTGFGPAIRQQWRTRGVAGFADLRMLEVFALNVVIDAMAVARRYEFPSWSHLAAEAAAAGLPKATLRGRCYGGPVDGMNVVGELSQR
jgi:SAM-dependent methyltransferase